MRVATTGGGIAVLGELLLAKHGFLVLDSRSIATIGLHSDVGALNLIKLLQCHLNAASISWRFSHFQS